MNVLHINCNYLDSWLHQTMIDTLVYSSNVSSEVFVPVHCEEGHIVTPNDCVHVSKCFNKWDRVWFSHKQRKIRNQVEKEFVFSTVDCIHAYTVFTDGNVARYMSRKYNIPYVVAVRNTDVNTFFKMMPHLRGIGIRVLRDAKAIFFLSDAYKCEVFEKYIPKRLHSDFAKKSYIIPNGIDEFWHENRFWNRNIAAIEKRIEEKKLRLIYAGGVDRNKNITETCQAIELLKSRGWQIDFSVVGRVKNQSLFEEIKGMVDYHEALPKEKLIDFYRSADIFVMPSHKETFGLVYVEAMSQGLPVIYTRGQGFDGQFLDGEVGYCVSDRDESELAQSIIKCAENYRVISEHVIEASMSFSWDLLCKKYSDIYKSIIK